jgi:hypothetical protein
MRLKIILTYFVVILLTPAGFGQTSTASPYSIFGLGQVDFNGSGKSRMLGGTGIGLKSDGYLNNLNPASYSALDSMSFIFEIGLQSSVTYYKSYDLQQRNSTTNINYLGMGFLLARGWSSSIGIKPFSHVGYNIAVENYIEGTTDTYYTYFKGEGDINQIYWGHSISLIKNLSLGLNASYLFGPIEQEEHVLIPLTDDELILTRKKHVRGLYLDYGLQYSITGKKWDYTMGMVYGPKKELKSTYTLTILNSYDTLSSETIADDNRYIMPQKFGLGFSMINKDKTISLSADYRFEEWSKLDLNVVGADYKNSHRYSFGLELIPGNNMRDSYIKRIHYMFGGYYTFSNLEYKGVKLDEKGLSLGFGFPIKKNTSFINLGFDIGERGSLESGLIKENFYNVNISFSLKDDWFVKQKYR